MSADKTPYKHPEAFPVIDNVIYTPGMSKEILQYFKDLPIKADRDIFVDTYPKSGTTWLTEIIWQIYNDGNNDFRPINVRVPFLERWHLEHNAATKKAIDDLFLNHPSPRVFKLHLPYHLAPMVDADGGKPKYFYVIRNPKDVAVSYYYHYLGLDVFEFNKSWDEFFEMFINDKVAYGSWFDHVLGWWAHHHDSNILFLKYEDMKKNLVDAVQQIAKHLGKDLSLDVIKRIADQTTFTAMSGNSKGRFYDTEKELSQVPKAAKFLRKGEVGDWQSYFTEEQSKRFDEVYEKRMAGSGLELDFYS